MGAVARRRRRAGHRDVGARDEFLDEDAGRVLAQRTRQHVEERAQIYARMGIRGWRSELSWSEDAQGNAQWARYDRLFAAAKAAFAEWSRTSLTKRTNVLFAFRQLLNERKEELAAIITAAWASPM